MQKILIVDDEPLIREGMKQALEMEDFQVEIAGNGSEALEIINDFNPQLVITDIIMPEKDGIEVIWTLREKYPDVKIIAISGGGRISANDHLKIAKKLGANTILTKPFSTTELVEEINKVLK